MQTIWLGSESVRVDLEHKIDWKERHQILKLAFAADVNANEAAFDIQFGHVKRPTHKNTSWDSAKFEVCAHKWVDISEYGFGVAILNDSKYGHSVDGNVIAVSCLKCPTDPNPISDYCEHLFTISVYPHGNDFQNAGVIDEALALNQPLVAMNIPENRGTMPEIFSLISVDESAIVIDGVKRAEDSDALVVRLYESFGGSAVANVRVPDGIKSASLANLSEEEICKLNIENGVITLPMHAFEIATLILYR